MFRHSNSFFVVDFSLYLFFQFVLSSSPAVCAVTGHMSNISFICISHSTLCLSLWTPLMSLCLSSFLYPDQSNPTPQTAYHTHFHSINVHISQTSNVSNHSNIFYSLPLKPSPHYLNPLQTFRLRVSRFSQSL